MTTSAHVQAPDDEPLDLDAVVAALSAGFLVTTGPRETIRRSVLDTFDRRLRAKGLSLEQVTSGSTGRFVLGQPDGASMATQGPDLSWPAFADALPEGSVRDAVAPVTGIRALTVQREEKRRVRRLELRNEDEKLVVRLAFEEPIGASSSSAGVTVEALRGYDDQGRKALRLLSGLRLRPAANSNDDDSQHDASTAADGDRTDRSAAAAHLLASELGDFLAAMLEQMPGLLDDVDTEFLHDFRVAVRRTRATLKLGRTALPEEMRTRWEPAFKWLGDLTTPVRDLDVYELELPDMARWLVGADAADLAPFATHVRRRRTAERRILVRGLRSARFQRLVTDWEQALAQLVAADADEGPRAGDVADRQLTRAYRRVARQGAAINADSPAEDLHTLRKRCKELRYALEVFEPVIDPAARKRAVSELKTLQDVLGRFQDSEVQRHALRDFAQEMMADGTSAQAVLAMGELVGHLDAEQDRARADFERTFARFVRPASDQRMRRLGGGR